MNPSDTAIDKLSNDELERGEFCKSVANLLVEEGSTIASGVVLGITGPWGSGKSSILNMVQEVLKDARPETITIEFQPWITSGSKELITSFLDELSISVKSEAGQNEEKRELFEKLSAEAASYAQAISKIGGVAYSVHDPYAGAAIVASSDLFGFWRGRKTKIREETILQIRDRLKALIDQLGRPVVVIMDEIDRLTDSEIISTAQLLKAVAHFNNVSFLLAYDAARIASAFDSIKEKGRGRSYLEKIVQYELPIPFLHPNRIKELLTEKLLKSSAADFFPKNWQEDEDYKDLVDLIIPSLVQSPRDIARLINVVSITQRMVGEDVHWVDAIGYHALEQKIPEIADRIRKSPWKVLSNSSFAPRVEQEAEMMRFLDREEGVGPLWRREILDDHLNSDAACRLMEFLFPVFKGEEDLIKRPEQPDFICNERSLTSLLQLGLPTGEISFSYLRENVSADHSTQIEKLRKAELKGKLEPFIERFSRIQSRFNRDQVVCMWRAVAVHCDQSINDHEYDPEYLRVNLTHRLFRDWLYVLKNNTEITSDVAGFAGQLMQDGSIEFLSCLLHYFSLHHGLFGFEGRNYDNGDALSRYNTEGYSMQWGETVSERLISKDLIKGLRTPHPLFLAVHTGGWKEKHKLTLSDLLLDEKVIDPVILSFFFGDSIVQRSFIEKLVDMDKLTKAFNVRLHNMMGRERLPGLRDVYKRAAFHLGIKLQPFGISD
ncbi:MAG: P-loop NTPase fold protein [Rhodospirillaceae bacterium]